MKAHYNFPTGSASLSDFTLDTTALTFPALSTAMQCADITIIGDDVLEGDETFTVTIDVTTTDVTEGNTMTTVTITGLYSDRGSHMKLLLLAHLLPPTM